MNYRNPKYNQNGSIDCEINHPVHGWIPFTANPDDLEDHGREIHAAILESGDEIAPAPGTDFAALRDTAKERIDTAAGAARQRFVSAGQLIQEEYRQALTAVQQWRAAGSPADAVPPEIQSGADYSGITHEEAAVEIEQTAAQWEGVLAQIRSHRLGGKSAVKAALDADIETTAKQYIDQLEAMAPAEE